MIEILGAIIISIFAVLLAAVGVGIVCDESKRSKSVSNDAIIDESRSPYKDTNDAANEPVYQETHDLQTKSDLSAPDLQAGSTASYLESKANLETASEKGECAHSAGETKKSMLDKYSEAVKNAIDSGKKMLASDPYGVLDDVSSIGYNNPQNRTFVVLGVAASLLEHYLLGKKIKKTLWELDGKYDYLADPDRIYFNL